VPDLRLNTSFNEEQFILIIDNYDAGGRYGILIDGDVACPAKKPVAAFNMFSG
jgi:hypothetical protein